MKDSNKWFVREVISWRTANCMVWTIIIQFLIIHFFLFVSTIDILHPTEWLLGWFFNFISLTSWGLVCVMSLITAAVSYANVWYYSVTPSVVTTRIELIWNVIKPQRILHALIHTYLAAFSVWCYLNIRGGLFSGLSSPCKNNGDRMCLNEYHLLIVLYAAFTGWLYSINYFLQNSNYMPFPIIQQPKVFLIKSLLVWQLFISLKSVGSRFIYFYFVFHFIGFFLEPSWGEMLGLSLANEHSVGLINGLVNYNLIWTALSSGVLVHFTWQMGRELFWIYITEPLSFPVESACEDIIVQKEALSYFTIPLLQYLSFQDLSLAVQHSFKYREQIFSLSQPGGHPYNWKSIYTSCVREIEVLIDKLLIYNNNANSALVMNGSAAGQPLSTTTTLEKTPFLASQSKLYDSNNSMYLENISKFGLNNNDTVYYSPDVRYRGPPVYMFDSTILTDGSVIQGPVMISFRVWLKQKLYQIWLLAKKTKIFSYFLNELPGATSWQLFTNAQLYIWAIDALSHLTSVSYKEDKFGVVQQNLSDIITILLDLHQVSKKHLKFTFAPSKKNFKKSKSYKDITSLRNALRATIKSAIYRIAITFGNNLSNVNLSPDHVRQLKQFLDYKE